jgi:hypothetical protein
MMLEFGLDESALDPEDVTMDEGSQADSEVLPYLFILDLRCDMHGLSLRCASVCFCHRLSHRLAFSLALRCAVHCRCALRFALPGLALYCHACLRSILLQCSFAFVRAELLCVYVLRAVKLHTTHLQRGDGVHGSGVYYGLCCV